MYGLFSGTVRKRIEEKMDEQRGAVIGVDLGGTKFMAGLFNDENDLLAKEYVPVDSLSPEQLLAALAETVGALAASSDLPVRGVGYGIPSTIDQRRGMVVVTCNLPLKDLPMRDEMRARTGLPSFIDNDANVAALAEQRLGAGRGAVSDLVMVTLGTGFGGGVILGGRLMNGSIGAAGELGHMSIAHEGPPCVAPNCPGIGCIESFCSGSALARDVRDHVAANPGSAIARAVAAGEPGRGELVVRLATAGDGDAQRLLARLGEHLGVGLANFVNIFNPEMIVVGGGLSAAREWILPVATRVMRERALPPGNEQVQVVSASFGAEAGMVGAALLARDGLARGRAESPASVV